MKNLKYFTVILLVSCSVLLSQSMRGRNMPSIGVLSGVVVDSSTGTPVHYASVSVISLRSDEIVSGGITDKDGQFYIEKLPLGKHQAVIEFIGYKKKTIGPILLSPRGGGIEQNLGEITLVQTSLEFEAVDVVAERPMYTQTAEKKIFNVEQSTLASGGSALDALRQVPGVDVDIDGKVSLRGSTQVNMLIDGKPSILTSSDQEAMLEAIPADNIQDIEVITNPSAKYDPEGMAGIINIVLKENKFAGLNGNIKVGTSTNNAYNTSGQLNFRNEKVNLFMNGTIRNNVRGGSGFNYREATIFGTTSMLDQEISGARGGKKSMLKTGVELYINQFNTIGMTATYSISDRIGDRDAHTFVTPDTTEDSILEYTRIGDNDNDHTSKKLTLSYDKKFRNPKRTFSAYVDLSKGNDGRLSNSVTEADEIVLDFLGGADPEKTTTDNEKTTFDLQADYVHPFGKNIKLEAGYKGSDRGYDNQFFTYDVMNDETVLDSARSNHFLYDENIQAAYAQFTLKKGIWGINAGLRGETVTTVSELRDTDEHFENPYTSYFPSGSISVDLPLGLQLQTSYSRRINRPSYRKLNPVAHQYDQNSIRKGNPFLKPEYIDVAEVNVSWYTASVGAYYRKTHDKINYYKTMTEEGVTIVSFENFDEEVSYGLEGTLFGPIGKKLRLMLSGNVYMDEVDASSVFDNDDYDHTSTGFMGRFSATMKVTPSFEVMLMGFYRSGRDIPLGKLDDMSFMSLSVKKKYFDNRFAVSLKFNDLFDTMGFGFVTRGENYYQKSNRKFESQIATISLEYFFGEMEDRSKFGRKKGRERNGSDMGGFEIE